MTPTAIYIYIFTQHTNSNDLVVVEVVDMLTNEPLLFDASVNQVRNSPFSPLVDLKPMSPPVQEKNRKQK